MLKFILEDQPSNDMLKIPYPIRGFRLIYTHFWSECSKDLKNNKFFKKNLKKYFFHKS